jgi:NDP-sugar pyrophosphorylase family protein
MKVVILAGGLGKRLSEETSIKPKLIVKKNKNENK